VKEGLKKALEIIKKEKEFAITVNPQMAMGMSQIEMLINKELEQAKKRRAFINGWIARIKEGIHGESTLNYISEEMYRDMFPDNDTSGLEYYRITGKYYAKRK
jgi:hypothetical protein